MASPRLGWASCSLMRAHREKPLRAGGGDGFAENSSAPGRSWATAEFHTSPRPPKHGQGPESCLCPPGSPWVGSPWDGWHAEVHCLGRQPGKSISPVVAAARGLTRVTAMFPAAPSWSPPKIFTQPNPAGVGAQGAAGTGVVVESPSPSQPSARGPALEQDVASLPPCKPGFMSKLRVPHSFPSHSSANVSPAAPGAGTGGVAVGRTPAQAVPPVPPREPPALQLPPCQRAERAAAPPLGHQGNLLD